MTFIKFKPLLKSTLWGGEKIVAFKHMNSQQTQVGESWEISGVENNESVVEEQEAENGKRETEKEGTATASHLTLNALVRKQKGKLVGEENYQRFGDEFPLLIKFIDAQKDLSIQVHPDNETACRQGKKKGKTEMWYIIDAAPDAKLYNGLKKQITPETYKNMVENDTICEALAQYDVREGDVFFIPAGRIHAIGAGCFIAEIQQTSDVTYRIYDFKRRDQDGNFRQLHTREAAESIDYAVLSDYRTHYVPQRNQGVQLVRCPYFTTAVYDLDEPMTLDYSELDSFVVLIGMKGEARLTDNEGNETTLHAGETVLIPATTQTVHMEGSFKFLETYV